MPNTLRIKIKNHTGRMQNYSFMSATPLVSGGHSGSIFSNVMRAAPQIPNGAVASFEVSVNYHAVCGKFEGTPEHGGRFTIKKAVPISLGSRDNPGSTVNLTVNSRSVCDLGPVTTPGAGRTSNFLLDTSTTPGKEFTEQDAKEKNLLVGLSSSATGDVSSVMSTFIPYPGAMYQIMPDPTFFVAGGERFDVGQLIQIDTLSNSQVIDFAARGTNIVTLSHTPDGSFDFM